MNIKRIPKNPESRRAWLIYQLRLVKSSFAKIAAEYKVSRQAVHLVNKQSSPKWERIIAQKIEMLPEQIWPERYPS